MRVNLTIALLLADSRSGFDDAIEREAYRLRPPPVIPLPQPPAGPTCAYCGVVLRRIEYSTIDTEPAPKCQHCIDATPGRERMAAKRARRAKRARS